MTRNRSRALAAIAFLSLLAGSLDLYGSVVPTDAGTVLRASAPDTLGAAMDKVLAEKEAVEDGKALVALKNIQFKGLTILGDMELQELVSPYIGVPMSYEQMLDIGMAVETHYRKNNYLARAILPPQDLTDGVLTVEVIESVFSKAEVEQELADLPNTQQHVTHLIQVQQTTDEFISAKTLDRGVALANDSPSLRIQGPLRQGYEAAETELLLELYKGRTRQTELTADSGGSRITDAIRLLASMSWFDPKDLTDVFDSMAFHTRGSDYARLARVITQGFEMVYPLLGSDDDLTKVLSAQVEERYRDLNQVGFTDTYSVLILPVDSHLTGSLLTLPLQPSPRKIERERFRSITVGEVTGKGDTNRIKRL